MIYPDSAAVFDLDMNVPAGADYAPFLVSLYYCWVKYSTLLGGGSMLEMSVGRILALDFIIEGRQWN